MGVYVITFTYTFITTKITGSDLVCATLSAVSAKTPLDMTPYAFGCEKFVTELSARPTSLRLLLIVGPNQEHLVV